MTSQARNSLKGGETSGPSGLVARKHEKGHVKMTMVRKDGIMKELIEREEKSKSEWEEKFGFLKNTHKDFQKRLIELKLREPSKEETADFNSSKTPTGDKLPKTTSGLVGWNADGASLINAVAGPLYISPKLTLRAEGSVRSKLMENQKHIILG
ncbi:uncharacterized protein C20orf85 homolog [Neocloeon triangulifer]|uniref:uncharacterized protein C20orf85 homolog n=1 Tax=Neocloeon triangulifer TaxID=2078957 RepID=UPI00286F718B|nr:uncharacterized protein C20orf85 homolog [Neocloeon triangulifer]